VLDLTIARANKIREKIVEGNYGEDSEEANKPAEEDPE
jgi:hypothetical protein